MKYLLSSTQSCNLDELLKGPSVLALETQEVNIFHIVTLVIFVLAIIHTLLANKITNIANRIEDRHLRKTNSEVSFLAEVLHFFGEVEVIFGLWVIPLFFSIASFYNWTTALQYINTRNYTEAVFVVVIMSLTASRPIVQLAEKILETIANWFGGSLSAWWFTILTLGPLLGSIITEAGAMALAAMLLSRQFYQYEPSPKLCYATLALLFTNISVGGVLTNFAAPPVLIISRCWDWSSIFMLTNFGWKAVVGIIVCNLIYWSYFRKEFRVLSSKRADVEGFVQKKPRVPLWITLVHIFFVVWTVANSHYLAVFVASFLMFLGFHRATRPHQYINNLKRPLLVGFFLAGLVIHGGLQGWWVTPLLQSVGDTAVMGLSVVLTAFNDNAAISYLSSLIPSTPIAFKYAVISGVVTGGGLTVIANAPNPAGYVILGKHFQNGISSLKLFLFASLPTSVFFLIFWATKS